MGKSGLSLLLAITAVTSNVALAAPAERYEPRQRVVISDGFTSWLLKGDPTSEQRYGEGEALPRLLADGWTIDEVSTGCGERAQTVYVLNAPSGRDRH